jgi:diacylglycerol kinase (ATP)
MAETFPGSGWSSILEVSVVAMAVVRLTWRGRWRAASTVSAAWAGAEIGTRVWPARARGVGVGAAYGLGRIAPPWRIPLLAVTATLEALNSDSSRGVVPNASSWLSGLGGAMAAVAIADWLADRRPRSAPPRQVAVVVNVNSGSPHLARRAVRALRRQPLDIVGIQRTTGPGLADALDRALATLAPDGILAVAGGDGTVGKGAAAAGRARRTVAILPTGTGNDVARSLGLPLSPEEAVDLIAETEPSPMDLGITDDGSFAHAATVGMTADFAERVRDVKGWRRPVMYPLKAWQTWRDRRPLAVEVVVDGRSVVTPTNPYQVAVVNAPRLGGRIGVTLPGSAVDDGLLDAVLSHREALRDVARSLSSLMRAGTARRWPGAIIAEGQVVEVRSVTPLIVSLDGEPVSHTPLRAHVQAQACSVIRPSRTRQRLHRHHDGS